MRQMQPLVPLPLCVFGIRSESKVLGMSIMPSVIAKLQSFGSSLANQTLFPVFGHARHCSSSTL